MKFLESTVTLIDPQQGLVQISVLRPDWSNRYDGNICLHPSSLKLLLRSWVDHFESSRSTVLHFLTAYFFRSKTT